MTIGASFKTVLPPDHRQAIYDAIVVLIDQTCEDIATLCAAGPPIPRRKHLRHGRSRRAARLPRRLGNKVRFEDLELSSYLPPQYAARYTPVFVKQFLACLMTVSWKLRSPEYHDLACVGEELALAAILHLAEALLEDQGLEPNFTAFVDVAFEDTDFEYLFEPEWDGIEDSELAGTFGIADLRFADWMKPFRGDQPVHPYCEDGADAWEASLVDEALDELDQDEEANAPDDGAGV